MRINLANILLGLLIIGSVNVWSQQTRQTNMYGYNKYSMNPAYAGASGCTEINFSHLNQWVKVDGAPITNYLSANTRFGKALGVGANVMIDKIGMLQNFTASGSVAYGFTFAKEHIIRLGVSAGYFQLQLDPSSAIAFDQGDVIVEGGVQSANSLLTEAGILYQFKGLDLSFSSQQVLETRSSFSYASLDGYGLKRHFTGYGAYNFILSKTLSLKPSVLYKGLGDVNQFDFNADLNYNDFLFGGIGYRTEVGLIGRVGINIRKMFFIGYAYELPMQNIASYGAGSHEITLGLKFCKKDKVDYPDDLSDVEPVHERIDTVIVEKHVSDTIVVERIDTVYVKDAVEAPTNKEVERAMFNASNNLEFEYDKAIILKKSYGDLESLTNMLLIREELVISLAGHTDSNGTEDYNMRLSKNRVESVKNFLVANGVDPNRIKTSYFGESKPIADNNTAEGQAKNRRVEMKIE